MITMLLIFIAALCLVLIYILLTKNSTYWKKKNVVQKNPLPLIGNMARVVLGKESLGMAVKRFYDILDDSVPYFGFYVFETPYLVLKSQEMIKQVLIRDFNAFSNRPMYSNEKIDPISANVLFTLKDEPWRELRKKLTPLFTAAKMKMMFPLIKEITNELEDHLGGIESKEFEAKDLAKRYAIDTISSCAFGINSNSIKNENSKISKMIVQLIDMKKFVRVVAAFAYFSCPILVKIFRLSFVDRDAAQYLIKLFKSVSEKRRKMKVKRFDFIDCLHSIQDQETEQDIYKFDDIKMSAQALVFFSAGTEPAALIISFLLYELAIQPEIQMRLKTEIRKNIDKDGCLSIETLNQMKYLDMVLKETLRKYPLTQVIVRRAEQDYIFEDTGLKIEKGTPILIPQLAIHLDPKYYPNPEKFDPERFQVDKPDDKCTYLPFGEGPRKCIGDRFAVMQMKIAIAMFLKNFEVAPCEKTEIPLKLNTRSFFLMPASGCIYLTLKRTSSDM